LLSKISKFSVKFGSRFTVSGVSLFWRAVSTQNLSFAIRGNLRSPFIAVPRNALKTRVIVFLFLLVEAILRLVCRAYFTVFERVAGFVVDLVLGPSPSLMHKDYSVDEVAILSNFNVAVAIAGGDLPGYSPRPAIAASGFTVFANTVAPYQISSFVVVVKKLSNIFRGKIVSILHGTYPGRVVSF